MKHSLEAVSMGGLLLVSRREQVVKQLPEGVIFLTAMDSSPLELPEYIHKQSAFKKVWLLQAPDKQ